jgi:hypothetical protein
LDGRALPVASRTLPTAGGALPAIGRALPADGEGVPGAEGAVHVADGAVPVTVRMCTVSISGVPEAGKTIPLQVAAVAKRFKFNFILYFFFQTKLTPFSCLFTIHLFRQSC